MTAAGFFAAASIALCIGCGQTPSGAGKTDPAGETPEAPERTAPREPTEEELARITYDDYREAPMLRARVAVGDLPPVRERLPEDPKVVETIEEIGVYGGEIRVLAVNAGPDNDMQGLSSANLLRIPRSGIGAEPDLAAGYDVASDDESLTITLRKGLKWSDGEPFTTEDFRFMFEDLVRNDNVRIGNSFPQVRSVEIVDDLTIRFVSSPFKIGNLLPSLAEWPGGQSQSFQPAHFLKKWHIDYNPDAGKIAKESGIRDWADALEKKTSQNGDPDLPVMQPWKLEKTFLGGKQFIRNPFFWRVDAEGNQLPYIDSISVRIRSVSTIDYTAYLMEETSTETDIVYTHTDFSRLGYYESYMEEGGFRIVLFPDPVSSLVTFTVSQNSSEPVVERILRSREFRQALSLSMNREEINQVIYMGAGVPGQAAPLPSTSFYDERWTGRHATHNPDTANRLLDVLGMTERDSNGFRKRPDGKPFLLVLMYSQTRMPELLELIAEYWQAVGLKTLLKQQESSVLQARRRTGEVMVYLQLGGTTPGTAYPPSSERNIRLRLRQWSYGVSAEWEEWTSAKWRAVKKQGDPPEEWWNVITVDDADLPEERPPEKWLENWGNQERWLETEYGTPEYSELAGRIFDFWTEELYHIGTVGQIPRIMLARNGLGNVLSPGWMTGMALDNELLGPWYDQLFWKTRE